MMKLYQEQIDITLGMYKKAEKAGRKAEARACLDNLKLYHQAISGCRLELSLNRLGGRSGIEGILGNL